MQRLLSLIDFRELLRGIGFFACCGLTLATEVLVIYWAVSLWGG